jgi:hypothetical protein
MYGGGAGKIEARSLPTGHTRRVHSTHGGEAPRGRAHCAVEQRGVQPANAAH